MKSLTSGSRCDEGSSWCGSGSARRFQQTHAQSRDQEPWENVPRIKTPVERKGKLSTFSTLR